MLAKVIVQWYDDLVKHHQVSVQYKTFDVQSLDENNY